MGDNGDARRKRKLVVDKIRAFTENEMKAQISNTSNIVKTFDLPPPVDVDLFNLPGRKLLSHKLLVDYEENLLNLEKTLISQHGGNFDYHSQSKEANERTGADNDDFPGGSLLQSEEEGEEKINVNKGEESRRGRPLLG